MIQSSTYSIKICHYNGIFRKTVELYREAVDYFIAVSLLEWDSLCILSGKKRNNEMERLTIRTKKRPAVKYDFSESFYKFPSYLRRSAIAEALGKAASYHSSLEKWEQTRKGRKPGQPCAGRIFPVLYRGNSFVRSDDYRARIKVFIRNTWDWLEVRLKKTDVDYILRNHSGKKECAPSLCRRGKEWFLDFPFQEEYALDKKEIRDQRILAVDLGINSACVCAVMEKDGTVAGREFLRLPAEKDCLNTSLNRIKKAQQQGSFRMPRLWGVTKGINDDIAVKTAVFIVETAKKYDVDVIVFEHLKFTGRKRGRSKQKLHMWKSQYVQKMVEGKAHREGIRISRINPWGTSAYAYDGSGKTERNIDGNYSICRFTTGKIYHCDLNAAYNIGARYFIRELIKSLPERERLDIQAKVPGCTRRGTRTLSTLINLYAVLQA